MEITGIVLGVIAIIVAALSGQVAGGEQHRQHMMRNALIAGTVILIVAGIFVATKGLVETQFGRLGEDVRTSAVHSAFYTQERANLDTLSSPEMEARLAQTIEWFDRIEMVMQKLESSPQ